MGASLTIHTRGETLTVANECPWNGYSIEICAPGQIDISLFVNLETWWKLRQFPKAEGYYYIIAKGDNVVVRDHARADELALEFYNAEKAKLLAPRVVETDIVEAA